MNSTPAASPLATASSARIHHDGASAIDAVTTPHPSALITKYATPTAAERSRASAGSVSRTAFTEWAADRLGGRSARASGRSVTDMGRGVGVGRGGGARLESLADGLSHA